MNKLDTDKIYTTDEVINLTGVSLSRVKELCRVKNNRYGRKQRVPLINPIGRGAGRGCQLKFSKHDLLKFLIVKEFATVGILRELVNLVDLTKDTAEIKTNFCSILVDVKKLRESNYI